MSLRLLHFFLQNISLLYQTWPNTLEIKVGWLLVLSLQNLPRARQTYHLMQEASTEYMNEGCLTHQCKIAQR